MMWDGPTVKLRIVFAGLVLSLGAAFCFSQAEADKQELAGHLQKAQEYLREKRPSLAIPELQAAVAIDPENVDAQANLGVLLYFQGRFTDAIPHLRAAATKQPDLTKIRGLLGIAESRTSDNAHAIEDLQASFPLIEEKKFKTELGLELVGAYTQAGDLDKAAATIALMRKSDAENAEVLYAAYRTYSELMVDSMLSLSLAAPDSAQMHQMIAHEETKQGNTNGAIAQYRQAIAINPNLPGVHFELAELLNTSQDAGIKKEARQEFLTALKQNPRDEKAECALADIDAQQGNIAQASAEYSRVIALQPGNSDAKLGLAKILMEKDQNDKALSLLEDAIRSEPTNAVAHYRLATLYRKMGRMEDAKHEAELYKQYKEMKEKLRASYKEMQIQPAEIHTDDKDEK